MKILIDARSMGTKPSGIGMYIYNFAKELVKEPDMEIHLLSDIATSNEMQAMEQAGAILHCYGTPVGKNFGLVIYYRYLQKVIHEIRPEIFWEGNSLVPIKVTNPYGKFMVTVHDLFPLTMPECFGKKYEYYFRYGLKNTLKYADTFIYNSMETKRDMERIFPQAAKKGSFLSYIIIDRIVHGEIEDNNAFLYVGNLEKRKGTDLLLDGYLEYLKAGGTKDLRFAGKIREADIEEKIRQVQEQTKKATYLGYLTKEDKEREYRQCSAFLFPSRAEGFGIINKQQNIEAGGITETEKNRFNSKFEILKGEELDNENVLKVVEAVKDNIINAQVDTNEEIKIEISRNESNQDIEKSLEEYIKKEKDKKYDIKIEYDEDTELVKYIIMTPAKKR